MTIKIISWNIWKGRYLGKVIEYLKSQHADVIALQEITDPYQNTQTNSAEIIAHELEMHFHFSKAFTTDRHDPVYSIGNAILSKSPLNSVRTHMLSTLEDYTQSADTEPRNVLEAEINFQGSSIRIFNTHTAYSHLLKPFELRRNQIKKLSELLPSARTVLVGDFNAAPDNPDMSPLAEKLRNADPNGDQPTWSVYPRNYKGFEVKGLEYRIDYIFVSEDLQTEDFRIGETNASDHLPLLVQVKMS